MRTFVRLGVSNGDVCGFTSVDIVMHWATLRGHGFHLNHLLQYVVTFDSAMLGRRHHKGN